jgi:hypothetical protein
MGLLDFVSLRAAYSKETAENQLSELLEVGGAKLHQMLKEVQPSENITDSVFSRIDAVTAGKIYQMLKILDHILTSHNIPYWIDGLDFSHSKN